MFGSRARFLLLSLYDGSCPMDPTLGCSSFLRWNSSCSSLKGLITSQCSSPPLYESARKAEQPEGQQRQPAYSKARDTWGTISASTHATKKDKRVTGITQNTHRHSRAWAVNTCMHPQSHRHDPATRTSARTVDIQSRTQHCFTHHTAV